MNCLGCDTHQTVALDIVRRQVAPFGVRKSPSMRSSGNNFAVGIRVPHSRRAALERAVAMRGLSVASFIEWLIGRALADAGLIDQPNPEGP